MTAVAMEEDVSRPRQLASTGPQFSCSINEFRRVGEDTERKGNDEKLTLQSSEEPEGDVTNYFKSIQWYIFPSVLFIHHSDQTLSHIKI